MRFKDLYDQDKDGKLNREEQLRWVAPNSYGSAREEVRLDCSKMKLMQYLSFNIWTSRIFGCSFSYCVVGLYIILLHDVAAAYSLLSCHQQALHLIKEMDHDGDGQISEAEVLKNQETFMNSEVTDYGRQLHVSHDEL